MNWEQLLSTRRLGLEDYDKPGHHNRTEFQRDYDRVIFSSPFRRLQNKTQVFPLPGRIFVHNRLTHSLEVASVGRSIGNNIARQLFETDDHITDSVMEIGSIVSAACLVHDLGNPPFGHSGENVISSFFTEGNGRGIKNMVSPEEWSDLSNFEGNANAFRLLTHQFYGRREGGFVLTYATLASTIKYPYPSNVSKGKKYGFFRSEAENMRKICDYLGMRDENSTTLRYHRHPLVYIVEAADDICYQIMDIEDAHKLGILSTTETESLFYAFWEEENRTKLERIKAIARRVSDTNEQIAYLRATVIGLLIGECTKVFIENKDKILAGTFEGSLMKNVKGNAGNAYKACSKLAVQRIYRSAEVVEIEIAGYKILSTLLDVFCEAVLFPEKTYSKQLLPRIPQQYEVETGTIYNKIRNVLDFISGMTDVYALDLYRNIAGISIPGVDKGY